MINLNSKNKLQTAKVAWAILALMVLAKFFPITLLAQNQNMQSFSLPEAGNIPHVACKSIELKPGYHYTAQQNVSMHAYINPYNVCDADYESGFMPTSNGILAPLDKSLEVGTTPGSFRVTSSGASTYTIPLIAPPGTSNLAPKLLVSYNSQAGNGLMGIGWTINGFGLSAITRTSQTIYYDNNVSPIALNNEDRFLLDGNHLLPTSSGSYGNIGMTYGTKSETFINVISVGGQTGNPASFTIQTKDGMTLEYGGTGDSRIEASNSASVLTWLLNKVTDPEGNYMKIRYFELNGEYRPDYIEYTGNNLSNPQLDTYNYIKFVYNKRKDVQVNYIAGSTATLSTVLIGIEMRVLNTIVHKYSFTYSNSSLKAPGDAESRLSEITEYGSDEKQFNSIKIGWDKSSDGTILPFTSGGVSLGNVPNNTSLNYASYTGDFNGDGFTDYFVIPNVLGNSNTSTGYLYLNNGNCNFQTSTPVALPIGFQNTLNTHGILRESVVDVNADGMDDIIMYGILSNTGYYTALVSNGFGFTSPLQTFAPAGNASTDGHYDLVGDFDGDGTTDLFVYYYDRDNWFIHNFKSNNTYRNHEDWGDYKLSFNTIDFDGDGKHEIMFTYNNPTELGT